MPPVFVPLLVLGPISQSVVYGEIRLAFEAFHAALLGPEQGSDGLCLSALCCEGAVGPYVGPRSDCPLSLLVYHPASLASRQCGVRQPNIRFCHQTGGY